MKFISVRLDKVIGIVKTLIYGESGNAAEVNDSNELKVAATVSGTVPLPTDAATAANQVLQLTQETTAATKLTALDIKDFATQTTLAAMNAKLVTGTVIGDVNVVSSTLPTGAATAANQTTGNTNTGNTVTELQKLNSLVPAVYDYIGLSYTGSNLTTVLFKTGGAGGSTVSTLTLGYDGSDNLITVTKT